jgi:hypothetical protein
MRLTALGRCVGGRRDGGTGAGGLRWAHATLLTTAASASPGVDTKLDAAPRVLVLSEPGGLGAALVRTLDRTGATGETVTPGSDTELAQVLSDQWAAVAVVTRDDVLALRLTLLCGHVRPDIPLWVTLFDRTLIHRLRQEVPSVNVVSSAELVARELADHCCALAAAAPRWRHGFWVFDGALRLLVGAGALGDWAWTAEGDAHAVLCVECAAAERREAPRRR